MAEVWCADDTQLDRNVALKILHPRFAQDLEFVERFRREASAAAGLQHPNVVNVFDRGEFDGTYYIAMEYVEGASLRDLISRGMSVSAAVAVTRQILAAAKFAHSHGVIHRDLKPGNVLVDKQGRVTVTDFGIAKAGVSEITQTGSVMGTAQYLSPEQAQGLEVTGASDLYSVGVVLYETLTGRVPFEADSAVAVALKQVSEVPKRPSEINPEVSLALDAVVMKALAKDPANRFRSADEFSAALDAAEANPSQPPVDTAVFVAPPGDPSTEVRGAPVEPPPEPPALMDEDRDRRRRRWRWAVLGVLLAALAALAVWALFLAPGQQTVPAVIGEDVEAATLTLEEAGFEVEVTEFSHPKRPGTVIEQDPRPGERAREGSTVLLSVSGGPGTARVPSVVNLPERRAVAKLDQSGFRVEPEQRFSDQIAAGRAIGTEPEQGTKLEQDSVVTLLVSKGSNLVEVPSVLGQQQSIAESQLRSAGLLPNVDTESSDEPEGTVIAQDPGAGSTLKRGSEVTIVVSTGAQLITVPSVVGQSKQAARATLRAQELKVAVEKREVTSERDDGVVVSQSPSAGTRVSAGDTVTLVVGRLTEPAPEIGAR
jgi:eukaryotic-like serine/threonine-protein kinase